MYMRMDAGFPQSAFGRGGTLEPIRGTFHYVSAGATMTVPLSNRNQGEAAAAEARRAQATADLDAARLDAASEVATARAWDAGARAALAAYSPAARSLARQNLDVVSRTYALGRATVFDVLAEERRYLESERAYAAMLRQAYDASRALRQALGEIR
jgi:cobalt-zinc-cadmium efflux system outer membrane protein